ncbi:hypothetical protein N7462_009225 [Penicillium macrosclerotiorum]|uniref:uncharacterized protein n=1 Tax=Penicillium macrosclerotiorum TaxID=303699 RepID=UPI00254949FC|nr:uncharacterized protein N7462_009225 [Penicillium macrosclerotiorum]KAJ5673786.1 hypothetical protein N7462_009225 [Penicillium macrosclerotiorum]
MPLKRPTDPTTCWHIELFPYSDDATAKIALKVQSAELTIGGCGVPLSPPGFSLDGTGLRSPTSRGRGLDDY